MNHSYFTSPEPLEQRIAPAGLVSVSFSEGLLTISGTDGADHDVSITKTGAKKFTVEGNATGIDEVGQTSKSFRGALKSVLIEGGSGADTFELTNLSPLKSLGFNGGAGVDSLTGTQLKTKGSGSVDIDLGSQTGSVDFSGSKTVMKGDVNINLGEGGAINFSSPVSKIGRDVVITGNSGSDSLSLAGETTVMKGKLTFVGGDGNDSFSAAGNSLKVQGFVTLDGGAGTDTFVFGSENSTFGKGPTPGLVDLQLGVGAGTVTFLGNSINVLGDLKIDLGTGGGTAQLHSAVTEIRDHLQVTGGAGNDILDFDGEASIGKSLSFFGSDGDDILRATGSSLSVKGDTSMDAGTGASTFDLNVVSVALAGLTVSGGTSNDTVSIIADGTIAGDVSLDLGLDGTGASSTILQSRAGVADGLKFGGTLTIDMVGATVDVLTIANIQVAKAFVAQTGENVSTVNISQLNARSNAMLKTGSGADVVNIDNINSLDLFVDTESGADELRIERNVAHTGTSNVLGIATILTGIGADQIRVGDGSDPANLKVSFMGAMTLDAGDGENMRNDVVASNFFETAPTVIATGGTLTQTEAV